SHNQAGILTAEALANAAARITVIDHPLIVNRKAPILSILSWRILYSFSSLSTNSVSIGVSCRFSGILNHVSLLVYHSQRFCTSLFSIEPPPDLLARRRSSAKKTRIRI